MRCVKILVLVVATGGAFGASFNSLAGSANSKPGRHYCMNVYDDAKLVMKMRQQGIPLPEMMNAVDEWKAGQYLVQEAFQRSQLSLPENQDRAVKEFAEQEYNRCMERSKL